MKTKRIVTCAMLSALYVVLANWLSLPLGPMKLTLDGLPIILAGLLFGPMDGLLVGLVGNLLSQLLGPYGLSATTLLWALPDALRGLLVGLYRPAWGKHPNRAVLAAVLAVTALVVTGLTTGVMFVDCLVFRYSFYESYAPVILWRILAGLIMAGVFTAIVPPIMKLLRRALPSRREGAR